jgi:hypothetical protein
MPAPPPKPPRIVIPAKSVGEIFRTLGTQQSNWLLCDGSIYDTEFYPELYEFLAPYVSDSYLVDGYLPDCRPRDDRGRVVVGNPGQFIGDYGTFVPTYIVAASVGNYVV